MLAAHGPVIDPASVPPEVAPHVLAVGSFLARVYGHDLALTEPRFAPSLIWRSDRECTGMTDSRFAHRVHAFGARSDQTPRYLGLVNCRPIPAGAADQTPPQRLICEAFLRPPLYLERSGFSIPTLGGYAVEYGIEPFACLPYASPHPQFGGCCAQACVYMASVIVPNARAVGIFEMTAALMEADGTQKATQVLGLDLTEMERVLKSPDGALAGGVIEVITFDSPEHRDGTAARIFADFLCEYVAQGIPCIVPVEASLLGHTQKGNHAILVVGLKQSPGSRDWVYLDPADSPYKVVAERDLLQAVLVLPSSSDAGASGPSEAAFLACTPRGVHLLASQRIACWETHARIVPYAPGLPAWLFLPVHTFPSLVLHSFGLPQTLRETDLMVAFLREAVHSGYLWVALSETPPADSEYESFLLAFDASQEVSPGNPDPLVAAFHPDGGFALVSDSSRLTGRVSKDGVQYNL